MIRFDVSDATVEETAKVLDQMVPKWYHKIDLGSFNFASPCQCVIGQLCGNYYDRRPYLDKIGVVDTNGPGPGPFSAESGGFSTKSHQWRLEIEKRLVADPKPNPKTYSVGTWFKAENNQRAILAQVGPGYVALIQVLPAGGNSQGDANRVQDSVKVEDSCYRISEAEWKKIKGQQNWVEE